MRVYLPATPEQIKYLLAAPIEVSDYLTPAQFNFDANIDIEEQEHLISLLAAEDSLELNQGKFGLVIAADFDDQQLGAERAKLDFKDIAAVLHSTDGEELSWFAPNEIQYQIGTWLS